MPPSPSPPRLKTSPTRELPKFWVYAKFCDINDIPASVFERIVAYTKVRHDEVLDETKSLMAKIYSVPNLDAKTAKSQWCSFARPKLLENFSKYSEPKPAPPPQTKINPDLSKDGSMMMCSVVSCWTIPNANAPTLAPEPTPNTMPPTANVNVPKLPSSPQATAPTAPPTIPASQLGPLSHRLAEINQLVRQSLPIVIRHCSSDAACRKDQTAAIHELAAKETAIAKALRNPTTYTTAVQQNDIVNACKVMWAASEDFAETVKCINDSAS